MRATALGALVACMVLCGCDRSPQAAGPKSQSRFAGIGVFDAGKLWAAMASPAVPKDAATAGIADDEHIIVVLDSHTGEVRQCGDHSGYCVAMNPWTSPNAKMPVKLARPSQDVTADNKAEPVKAPPTN